ncbi:hypothetical protein NLI96_g6733 [Meripilus lineatus]|uniref:Uncharacterized protein n=1 Tax=Meripilus lineatus TaxID=2056292 RepID=A0AAD5V0G6_9APHY|nr:hypothetical protein NLI96_g6733 [Physisporinus lineatus]
MAVTTCTPTSVHNAGTVTATDSTTSAPFAFAQINGEICLVQLPSPLVPSPFIACDVRLFRHELITIFRYSHSTSFHPSDIQILEFLDERTTLYEEDKGTVFLSREAVARMQRLAALSAYSPSRHYQPAVMGFVRKAHLTAQGARPSRMARIH